METNDNQVSLDELPTNLKIDPVFWYSERMLNFTPRHFVVSKTPLSTKSFLWIINNLTGRFSVTMVIEDSDTFGPVILQDLGNPAFEDPKEAILYELTWS